MYQAATGLAPFLYLRQRDCHPDAPEQVGELLKDEMRN